MYPIILALTLPILAIFFSQLFRQEWQFRMFDGPMRMLLASIIFVYFYYKKLDFARIIALTAAPALWLMPLVLHAHPEVFALWNNRFATAAVDPTALGTYSLVLIVLCLFSIENFSSTNYKQILFQLSGILAGIYVLIGTETRGGWLPLPIIFMVFIALNKHKINVTYLKAVLCLLILSALVLFSVYPSIWHRLASSYVEIVAWLDHTDRESSTGLRLTMWQMSWALFQHNPIYGYGETGFADLLQEPWIMSISSPESRRIMLVNGPHNELISNLIRSGFMGGISVLAMFFIPLHLFWQNRHNTYSTLASHLGIAFVLSLILASISSEVVSLKYTRSFYGLLIAGLTAQTIREQLLQLRAEST
jgi:O-antigen ligase